MVNCFSVSWTDDDHVCQFYRWIKWKYTWPFKWGFKLQLQRKDKSNFWFSFPVARAKNIFFSFFQSDNRCWRLRWNWNEYYRCELVWLIWRAVNHTRMNGMSIYSAARYQLRFCETRGWIHLIDIQSCTKLSVITTISIYNFCAEIYIHITES